MPPAGLHVAAAPHRFVRTIRSDGSPPVHERTRATGWAKLHRLLLDELGSRGELHADKGYDYSQLRRCLSARGIRHVPEQQLNR
ncbi:hypothetical protein GCM10010234_65690 [Streptomyces hawaiiensis]